MKENRDTISSLGEFGLIERLRAACPEGSSPDVIVGIGDDTAVLRLDDRHALLATCDIQVQDVHFRLETISPEQLGRRAMAVNISDIAAMGGSPTYALVSMALPPDLPLATFDGIFEGMRAQMAEYSAGMIGGNLARTTGPLVIDVFMMGRIAIGHLVTRHGARPGDDIYITGETGRSSAGCAVLDKYGVSFPDEFADAVLAHRRPVPRVKEGTTIAQSGAATAMIDLSDGLAADLAHICRESNVGAEMYEAKIPCSTTVREIASALGENCRHYILYGGEDYELLFTARPEAEQEIQRIAGVCGTPMRKIGRILPPDGGIKLVEADGTRVDLHAAGWNHFTV